MQKIKIIWKHLKTYWYLPLAFLLFFLFWIFFHKTQNPIKQVKIELEAIKAKEEVKILELEKGRDQAVAKALQQYEVVKEELTSKQKKEAKELENDPVKLSAFLIRAVNKPHK